MGVVVVTRISSHSFLQQDLVLCCSISIGLILTGSIDRLSQWLSVFVCFGLYFYYR
jgi:hypothetical protein